MLLRSTYTCTKWPAAAGSGSVKTGPAKLTYAGAGVKEFGGGANPGYRVEAGTLFFDAW